MVVEGRGESLSDVNKWGAEVHRRSRKGREGRKHKRKVIIRKEEKGREKFEIGY